MASPREGRRAGDDREARGGQAGGDPVARERRAARVQREPLVPCREGGPRDVCRAQRRQRDARVRRRPYRQAGRALLKGARADETGNAAETGDLQAGASKTLRLKLKPGHDALICNLPGHCVAGQHTDFTVR